MTKATTIECPTWCDQQHGRNELEIGDYVHVHRIADLRGSEVAIEQMVLSEHQVTTIDPVITLRNDHADSELSASEARQYAAALLNAADELDRIIAGTI